MRIFNVSFFGIWKVLKFLKLRYMSDGFLNLNAIFLSVLLAKSLGWLQCRREGLKILILFLFFKVQSQVVIPDWSCLGFMQWILSFQNQIISCTLKRLEWPRSSSSLGMYFLIRLRTCSFIKKNFASLAKSLRYLVS